MRINEQYFNWMFKKVDGRGYRDLLRVLHQEDFYSILPLDDNRLIDGCELRYRFGKECEIPTVVIDKMLGSDTCSILEMMLGLAFRIEETIMEDSDYGDRTAMWFWIMVKSLGLYEMKDNNFDTVHVLRTLDTFLTRGYSSNGEGGLFTVKDTSKDMRDVDIWYQMCMFFDNLL